MSYCHLNFDDRSILLLFSNSISPTEYVVYVVQMALNSVMVLWIALYGRAEVCLTLVGRESGCSQLSSYIIFHFLLSSLAINNAYHFAETLVPKA